MANQTKNTTTPKKTTASKKEKAEVNIEKKNVEDKKVKDLEDIVSKQNKQMEAMLEQMKMLQSQIQATPSSPNVTVIQEKGLQSKKIKVISCVHCLLNLTTATKGGGTKYVFPHFGYSQNIKFEDLERCVHNHRQSAERGDFYICDPEAVADLGLTEEYQNLYNADELQSISHFENGELDVDKIAGLVVVDNYTKEFTSTVLRDSIIQSIAENIAKGELYDWNYINKLQEKTGVDINDLIDKAKELLLEKK